eukprot:CAMPEP_0198521388 /NCGR_PEP_ID=MMETSP1462-20131121/20904_1 /TAXON_ID=1333877 /ORGANISM="Brandtodinium nutriculum, Strain RCC3387" /LENGTH=285 /DNA_ID=CAMNT_0044251031 /DNA_START=158 /DNA_END=1011 /DNA_ORIENTATION=-
MGVVLSIVFCVVMLYKAEVSPALRVKYDANSTIAVVGFGPSGMTAAWLLAQGGRKVTVFEAEETFGGHSRSVSHGNMTVDVGYIFNSAATYQQYKSITDHFGIKRVDSALNTSGAWEGQYWDNTRPGKPWNARLEKDIDRFMDIAKQDPTVLRLLTPFGLWLWASGFSREFRKLCLDSTMSVLFVTKMGLSQQSAQAVLGYFRDDGFTHLRYDRPRVQYTQGGSQNMWRKFVGTLEETGQVEVRYRSRVEAVERAGGGWAVTLSSGTRHEGFGDVVMATPASVSS